MRTWQNLLLFDSDVLNENKYGSAWTRTRLVTVVFFQHITFLHKDGVIGVSKKTKVFNLEKLGSQFLIQSPKLNP